PRERRRLPSRPCRRHWKVGRYARSSSCLGGSSMSSARFFGTRVLGCALTLALLGGCGFTPVYGDHQQAAVPGNLSQVKVAQIPNHLGVVLTNRLRDAFDPTS